MWLCAHGHQKGNLHDNLRKLPVFGFTSQWLAITTGAACVAAVPRQDSGLGQRLVPWCARVEEHDLSRIGIGWYRNQVFQGLAVTPYVTVAIANLELLLLRWGCDGQSSQSCWYCLQQSPQRKLVGKVLHLSPPLGMRWVLHSFGLESADVAIGSWELVDMLGLGFRSCRNTDFW